MRAIIMTAPGLEHAFVANALFESIGDHVVGVILETARPSLLRNLRRHGPLRAFERVVTKVERRVLQHGRRQADALRAILVSVERRWLSSVPVFETESVNAPGTRELIRRLSPTHLLVYGTGIVRPGTAGLVTSALNMHTGLSPWYRGSDTEFWPMYRGEPHMVGVTVHEVTPVVDGGAIYARASVKLKPEDDPFVAFARCVQVGAPVYAGIASQLAAGKSIELRPQDLTVGSSFKFVDRTFVQDLIMEYRIRTGLMQRQIRSSSPLPFPAIEG